jgi:hypothetical protein
MHKFLISIIFLSTAPTLIFAQKPNWIKYENRNSQYPNSEYWIKYSSQRLDKGQNGTREMANMKATLISEVVSGIITSVDAESNLKLENTNGNSNEIYLQNARTRTQIRVIKNLKVESFQSKDRIYAMVLIPKEDNLLMWKSFLGESSQEVIKMGKELQPLPIIRASSPLYKQMGDKKEGSDYFYNLLKTVLGELSPALQSHYDRSNEIWYEIQARVEKPVWDFVESKEPPSEIRLEGLDATYQSPAYLNFILSLHKAGYVNVFWINNEPGENLFNLYPRQKFSYDRYEVKQEYGMLPANSELQFPYGVARDQFQTGKFGYGLGTSKPEEEGAILVIFSEYPIPNYITQARKLTDLDTKWEKWIAKRPKDRFQRIIRTVVLKKNQE